MLDYGVYSCRWVTKIRLLRRDWCALRLTSNLVSHLVMAWKQVRDSRPRSEESSRKPLAYGCIVADLKRACRTGGGHWVEAVPKIVWSLLRVELSPAEATFRRRVIAVELPWEEES